MHWLALVFPQLPLDAQARRPLPSLVGERGLVLVADDDARAAGVEAGMRLATARARLPGVPVLTRDVAAETTLLDELACACGRFTPDVCLQSPNAVLLDVGASLRLFGGPEALKTAVLDACRTRVTHLNWGGAPTPRAALWLARAAADRQAPTLAGLPEALADLPLYATGWPEAVLRRLDSFGATTLGDVLALPRPGLMRRLGGEVGLDLARALGEQFEPPPRYVFPPHFRQELALPGVVNDAAALQFAASRLLDALCGWLTARQAGVAECTLEFLHESRIEPVPPSLLRLRLQVPSRDGDRFRRLLRERLARLVLSSPVAGVRLLAGPGESLPGHSGDLPGVAGATPVEDIDLLIERLRGRLGDEAVHGVACFPEHRPECASVRVAVGGGVHAGADAWPPRPLWLRDSPQELPERDGQPVLRESGGPEVLTLVTWPERIESGWWDDSGPGDLRRDYFVARTPAGAAVWVYRDGDRPGWFLHGSFA